MEQEFDPDIANEIDNIKELVDYFEKTQPTTQEIFINLYERLMILEATREK